MPIAINQKPTKQEVRQVVNSKKKKALKNVKSAVSTSPTKNLSNSKIPLSIQEPLQQTNQIRQSSRLSSQGSSTIVEAAVETDSKDKNAKFLDLKKPLFYQMLTGNFDKEFYYIKFTNHTT